MNKRAFENLNADVFCLEETGSTNTYAKQMLRDGYSGRAVITADRQSAGRGRLGRSFSSPEGGIYMTLILEKSLFHDTTLLTAAAAVAVVRSIDALTDRRTMIKWVNDVYLEGKKLCGILCESVFDGDSRTPLGVIAGIGVNVNSEIPDELKDIAVSLESEDVSREQLAARIASEFFALAEAPKSCLTEYRARSFVPGRTVSFIKDGKEMTALAKSIDDECGLVVELPDKTTLTLKSGEVSVRVSGSKI